ncbi:hypothetical protein ACFOKC_00065 [Halobacterium litoreum]|uniref:Uncharacterized protein n=1 Tax=Halobacterium litoreum TaxID=2039234 RepID=A0ABD5NB18_9EURY
MFVDDAGTTEQLDIQDHSALAGSSDPDAHHARYSDAEAQAAADGVVDADTVDGQHASDLGAPGSTAAVSGPQFRISGRGGSNVFETFAGNTSTPSVGFAGHPFACSKVEVSAQEGGNGWQGTVGGDITEVWIREPDGSRTSLWSGRETVSGFSKTLSFGVRLATAVEFDYDNTTGDRTKTTVSATPFQRRVPYHNHSI